jgi:hypothetical protein
MVVTRDRVLGIHQALNGAKRAIWCRFAFWNSVEYPIPIPCSGIVLWLSPPCSGDSFDPLFCAQVNGSELECLSTWWPWPWPWMHTRCEAYEVHEYLVGTRNKTQQMS